MLHLTLRCAAQLKEPPIAAVRSVAQFIGYRTRDQICTNLEASARL